jgi:glycerol-3-phosphate dehydrogenase (NAD(P)+)
LKRFESIGLIGNGSWATALAKMLTDNGHTINWWMRNEDCVAHLIKRHHNPHYLSSVYFDNNQIRPSADIAQVVQQSDLLVICIPSAYVMDALAPLKPVDLKDKWIVSAVKGIIPDENLFINEFLQQHYLTRPEQYFCITGPCHAEEAANEKLSYLTFSGVSESNTSAVADLFANNYIQTIVNHDVMGTQYAAVLKNIYALGAGIAHGLDYGDNFLSVLITNSFREMQRFMDAITDVERHPHSYSSSAYLGDLLVTCYSLHSRNRTFGNMIGKGYSVQAAKLELNMVAEGYYASRCIFELNRNLNIDMPVASAVYRMLWKGLPVARTFSELEGLLV